MPYLGTTPATGYRSIDKQTITGTGATVYTLTHKVASANDVEVFVNNVRQEPGVAYTCNGNQITFTTAVESSDDCYVVFQGRAVTSNIIESQNIADGAVTAAKLDANAVPNEITKSATEPSNPSNGDFWYDTANYEFKFYDGSAWQLVKSAFTATGGTITSGGGYTYHTFTSSGTFEVTKGTTTIEALIVAGGGGGSGGAGGGAGGMIAHSQSVSTQSYSIVIGGGGAGITDNTTFTTAHNGENTTALGQTAIGGGGAGTNSQAPASGGSGGGGWHQQPTGASGTSGQGNSGGTGATNANYGGGGGGGAGAAGGNGSTSSGGAGGAGSEWLDGNYYAGGGSGAIYTTEVDVPGGIGGGGGSDRQNGGNGSANTGGGGGGVHYGIGTTGHVGGNGGSGIVIIRYAS
jgi:hypothetical protein